MLNLKVLFCVLCTWNILKKQQYSSKAEENLHLKSKMDVEISEIYVKPTDLPATTRIYPVKQAGERPEIGQVAAGPSNWILKPEGHNQTLKPEGHNRSPRSSKSSMSTQVTTLSNGGYTGIHAGLGTPMPWMTRRFQKM